MPIIFFVGFTQGYTYTYDAVFNVTAGVLGLSSQVSASVLRAKVKIYAETNTTHVLKVSALNRKSKSINKCIILDSFLTFYVSFISNGIRNDFLEKKNSEIFFILIY